MPEEIVEVFCPFCGTNQNTYQGIEEKLGYTCSNCEKGFTLEISELIPLEEFMIFEDEYISLQD